MAEVWESRHLVGDGLGKKTAGHTAAQVVLMFHVLGRPSYGTHYSRHLGNK